MPDANLTQTIFDTLDCGSRVAVRATGIAITYAELAARVEVTAAGFAAQGMAAGDRVMLACPPTPETIATALALLRLGCTVLPVAGDPAAEGLRHPREAFRPAWFAREGTVTSEPGAPGLGAAADPALRRDQGDVREPPHLADHPEAPRQALLSSGSTGRPKIVLRSAAQVEAGVRTVAAAMALGPGDRVLALVPLEHSFGFNSVMLAALTAGAEIVLPRSRHPRGVVREVQETGVTVFPAPPLFFDWMCRFAEERHQGLGDARVCVSVGDLLTRATHAAFVEMFGVSLWQSYGASEAGPVLLNRLGTYADGTVALGQPYPGVEVDLCDEQGDPVPDGAVGEIVVRSPAVGLGYLDEADGGGRFSGGRFFTGDLGVRRRGEIHFAGRSKVVIARAGRKIDPGEIERVLCSHPDVIDAAVRVAAGTGSDSLEALVVTRHPVPPEDLIALCGRRLAPFKVPRVIGFRRVLPRDAAGKLQRTRLETW